MLTDWAETLAALPPHALLLVAAGLLFVETALLIGFAVPAEITLLVVGLLSHQDVLPLAVALLVCVAAGIFGDQAAYWIGRTFHATTPGRRSSRLGRYRARAESLLRRRGGPAVFLARWIPFVRTCMPVTAGASGLSAPVFTLFATVGVATWMSTTVLIGYAAGGSLAVATTWAGRGTAIACLMVAITAAVVIIRRRRLHSCRS